MCIRDRRMSSNQKVLRSCRAVLHPESRGDEVPRIAADQYAKGCMRCHGANGLNVGIASSIPRSFMTINSHDCWFTADGALIAAERSFSTISSLISFFSYFRTLLRV